MIGPLHGMLSFSRFPLIAIYGLLSVLEVAIIHISSCKYQAVAWTNQYSTHVPSLNILFQYSFHVSLLTLPSVSSYCNLNCCILGWSELFMKFITLYLKALCLGPVLCVLTIILVTDLSCLFISGLWHCCITAIGKQLPLPSVRWSSTKGSCNLLTVSIISSAIILSTLRLSSYCCSSALLLATHTDFVQPIRVLWKWINRTLITKLKCLYGLLKREV